jgi:hypothetical protein
MSTGFVPYLRVTETKPEDAPERLAVRLAEIINGIGNFYAEADAFKRQGTSERSKAAGLRNVIFELKERKKNPPAKVSRMDPYNTYDLEACEAELQGYKDRSVEMDSLAAQQLEKRDKLQLEMIDVQSRIRRGNVRVVPRN